MKDIDREIAEDDARDRLEELETKLERVENADIEKIAQFIRDHAYVDRVGGPYHAAQKIIDYFNSENKNEP